MVTKGTFLNAQPAWIAELAAQIAEKDARIAEQDARIAKQDARIVEQDAEISLISEGANVGGTVFLCGARYLPCALVNALIRAVLPLLYDVNYLG